MGKNTASDGAAAAANEPTASGDAQADAATNAGAVQGVGVDAGTALDAGLADPDPVKIVTEERDAALEKIAELETANRVASEERDAALAKIVELETKLDALTPTGDGKSPKAKAIVINPKATKDDFLLASSIVFANAEGMAINQLPPLSFIADQFRLGSDGNVRELIPPIEFPSDAGACEVGSVFLIAPDGKPVSQCALVSVFHVGGGRQARLGAGSLAFTFAG